MGSTGKSFTAVASAHPRVARRDARRRKREELNLPARFWPFEPKLRRLQEIGAVLNFTREGLYFITTAPHYFVGMKVLVTFPFMPDAVMRDYLGKVVRLDKLDDDRVGIALRFIY